MDEITEAERNVVNELRKRTINDVTPKMLEDYSLFYRFAKAREFRLEEAELMLRKHISWRKEWNIDSILTDYEPPEVLVKYGSSSFVCFNKEGCIVRIQDFGRADGRGLCNSVTKVEMAKYSVYLAEKEKALLIKRGGNLGKPIYSPIYDFEEFTYAKAVNFKALQCLAYTLKVFIDNYPESVKVITVINAPVYFTYFYAGIKPILNSTIRQKVRIFGTDGWKDVLLKDIDADDLPAYLGGNRTDPDGNPLCKTFIQRGMLVPMKYYKQNQEKILVLGSDAEKITVKPFSNEDVRFEVKEENSYLEWQFIIETGDIDFSLQYRTEFSEYLESEVIIPKQRIDTSMEPAKGCFKCERTGLYTIIFDNSYSWMHWKEIYYRVGIRNPENDKLL